MDVKVVKFALESEFVQYLESITINLQDPSLRPSFFHRQCTCRVEGLQMFPFHSVLNGHFIRWMKVGELFVESHVVREEDRVVPNPKIAEHNSQREHNETHIFYLLENKEKCPEEDLDCF